LQAITNGNQLRGHKRHKLLGIPSGLVGLWQTQALT